MVNVFTTVVFFVSVYKRDIVEVTVGETSPFRVKPKKIQFFLVTRLYQISLY